ncbi:general secretion pathway protein GspK [Brevundimonas sp. AJA228-03]|uniref:general secretion pathway protein GspK n=1 Tax=Brevundimonas sp. AJA228-03 TaxID=2752515 RepID=UPI001AE01BE2|nr:type II secretion system protein GspK [Brevundimonas sp. AJA228-03]QTN20497.1 general secretion pathway protein GspK [Brevundimonas sp. AJA228-03]
MERRPDREGMILLNVLLVVAMASVTVLIMVAGQDIELQRSARLRDVAQASAYARAGELSAITSLRRDGIVAAGTDNLAEPWAALSQTSIAIPRGRFALTIEDEQARFNLNALAGGQSGPIDLFQRIGASAGVAPEILVRISTVVRIAGPLTDDRLLIASGVSTADLLRLRPFVTILPPEAEINLNTVGEPLLALMLNDPDRARELIVQRKRVGYLVPADLAAVGSSPQGTGFTSDHFRTVTAVSVGDVEQVMTSRLTRTASAGGVDVVVTDRTPGL